MFLEVKFSIFLNRRVFVMVCTVADASCSIFSRCSFRILIFPMQDNSSIVCFNLYTVLGSVHTVYSTTTSMIISADFSRILNGVFIHNHE